MAKAMTITDACPMELWLNILSGKWKLKILWHLSKNTVRFNELQRLLGHITTKILTQQLRELEEYGMIKREVYPENPPKVTYSLTELGYTILPVLKALCDWGTAYKNGNP